MAACLVIILLRRGRLGCSGASMKNCNDLRMVVGGGGGSNLGGTFGAGCLLSGGVWDRGL